MIYIGLSIIWALVFYTAGAFLTENGRKHVKGAIWGSIGFIVGFIVAYLALPSIGFFYIGTWLYLLTPVVVMGFICFFAFTESPSQNRGYFLGGSIIAVSAFLILSFFSTSAVIHSNAYHNLLDIKEEVDFEADSIFLDQTQARFVDQDLAQRAANELMGQERGMASRYQVGTMNIQKVNDQLRWVAPFEHVSFLRWFSESTIPGYSDVSANNYSDSKMTLNENTELNVGVDGFYFSDYLPRHLYQNGYYNQQLSDYTLELDDKGTPHWVVSKIEPQVGFSGHKVIGVVIVNATSKEINDYSLDNIPEWVDRVQPESLIEQRISDWGKYGQGWINATFIGNNTLESTDGSSLVFTKDGKSNWYTGMQATSTNNESTMGFMMVDSRTGKATYYQRSGITEERAKSAIEGRVQEAGYIASKPIPYNINGVSTFISILKDRNQNVQGIGLVAYNDRSKVAFGEDLDIAMRRYMSVISSSSDNDLMENMEPQTIQGTIERSYVQNTDNRHILNFTLASDEHSGIFFRTDADNNKSALLAREGDIVSFEVFSLRAKNISVNNFDNQSLKE